jgi:hypothetical protein
MVIAISNPDPDPGFDEQKEIGKIYGRKGKMNFQLS